MLTPKRHRFVEEYLVDLNATQAAIRAGYSKRSAHVLANEVLKDPKVAELIDKTLVERKIANQRTAEATHDEIRALAHSDPRSIFDDNGRVKLPSQWSDELARTIAAFELREEWKPGETREDEPHLVVITKVKFWEKPKALEMKGRTQRLFTDTLEVKLDASTADRLAQARERAKAMRDEPQE